MRKNPHAVALGRRGGKVGGKVKSAAKAAAARENGKQGGRPLGSKNKKKATVKTILIALALLFTATSARADDKPLLFGMAAAHLADIASTQIALRNTQLMESNPLMRHPAGLFALKGGVAAAQMLVVHRMWKTGHKRAALITALGVTAAYGMIGVHNARVGK